jgi:hypothetical protein
MRSAEALPAGQGERAARVRHLPLGHLAGTYVAAGLDLLELRGTQIAEVVSFLQPEIFAAFGLPAEVPGDVPWR